MESQNKDGVGGIESGATNGGNKEVGVANMRKTRVWDIALRCMALVFTLVAAVVLGVDKQTTTVSLTLVPTLPPVTVAVPAKMHYLSAFVFFVVANAVACAYAAISLVLTLANGGGKKGMSLLITLLDLVMVALLFSGIGAAMAIGVMGFEGNSHVQWNKVCDKFEKFCHQSAAAFVISAVGALAFFLLVVLATLNMHKKH